MIDLRSDTVTRPTPPMREAMARAEVGDDVYGEDPTVRALEETVASLLGKEAALFVPSGTMGNQLAIMTDTRRGDEVMCGEGAHLCWFESGAGAALSGVQFAVAGKGGLFDGARDGGRGAKPLAYYYPRTSLVTIENTHNRAGGRVFPREDVAAIARRARELELRLHLDGARLWNASAATGAPLAELAAPVRHGQRLLLEGARRARRLGARRQQGARSTRRTACARCSARGMRQAGILAAGALYALGTIATRLADDHEHAQLFAEKLAVGVDDARGDRRSTPRPTSSTSTLPRDVAPKSAIAKAKENGFSWEPSSRRACARCSTSTSSRADAQQGSREALTRAAPGGMQHTH